MFVKNIDVVGFRGIRGLARPLELSEFTVLVGRNNVGKTAILEALYLLTAPYLTISPPPYGSSPYSFISRIHGSSASLVYGYYGEAVIYYKLAVGARLHDRIVKSVEIRLTTEGVKGVALGGSDVGYERYREFVEALGAGFEQRLPALFIPNDSRAYDMLLGFAMKDPVLRWAEKEGYNTRVVAELVSKVVYDKFTEVLLRGNELSVRKEGPKGPMYIGLRSLGEGVKRIILIYYAVEYLNPKLILWDDVEVAAHPSLLEAILEWLASSSRQVMISTHSIDVLHILSIVRPKDCKVVVLRKTPDDVVEWRTLSLDEVEEMLDKGVDLRKIVDELEL